MGEVVCVPVANLYAQPNEETEVVSQALYGWPVSILEENEAFKKVRMADGYEGWIHQMALCKSTWIKERESVRFAKITCNAVHLYDEPTVTKKKPLMTLPFEVQLPIIAEPEEEEFRWIQVELLNGQTAWLQRKAIAINPPKLNLEQVLTLSQQFLGLPYTWGGVSSFGYDCSGFTQMLCRQMGMSLPRDASQQIQDGQLQELEEDHLLPGDLIFFQSFSQKITHVGMCLTPKKMIHATVLGAPILQVTELADPFLCRRFAKQIVRRLKFKDTLRGKEK